MIGVQFLQGFPEPLNIDNFLVDFLATLVQLSHVHTITFKKVPELVVFLSGRQDTIMELAEAGVVGELSNNIYFFTPGVAISHIIIVLHHLEVAKDDEFLFEGWAELIGEDKLCLCLLLFT